MKIKIQRIPSLKQLSFISPTHSSLSGSANITMGIRCRELIVEDLQSNIQYALRQENRKQKLISLLPLGNTFPRPYYEYYQNNVHVGRTKSTRYSTQTRLHELDTVYEMFCHGNNCISILKNGEQVALLQREPKIYNEKAIYSGAYDESNIDAAVLMLWIEYVDVTYFPMQDFQQIRIEKRITIGKDPFQERLEWKEPTQPND